MAALSNSMLISSAERDDPRRPRRTPSTSDGSSNGSSCAPPQCSLWIVIETYRRSNGEGFEKERNERAWPASVRARNGRSPQRASAYSASSQRVRTRKVVAIQTAGALGHTPLRRELFLCPGPGGPHHELSMSELIRALSSPWFATCTYTSGGWPIPEPQDRPP